MSLDWGRRTEWLHLDADALSRLVQPAFPGARVTAAEPLTAGHVNVNYKVQVSGREWPFVVRIHTQGAERARKEWDVLRLVHSRVPAPEIVWAGETDGPEGRPVTVLRWVEGVPLSTVTREGGADDIRQVAAAAGETLTRIGSFTFREAGFFGPGLGIAVPLGPHGTGVRQYVEHRVFHGNAGKVMGETLSRHVWSFAVRYAHRLNRLRDVACLGHADYHASNILGRRTAEGWTVAAVLDWEFAFSGTPLFDVGIMLRRTARHCPAFEEPFIWAFAEHGGELPPDWRALTRTVDLVNLLDFLERDDTSDALRNDVLRALQDTVDSLGRE